MTIKTSKSIKTSVAKKTTTQVKDKKVQATPVDEAAHVDASQVTQTSQAPQGQVQPEGQPITGRGIFAVRTLGQAVSVESAFLVEDGNVLRLPAVFPNRQYALEQVEELRQLIHRHFDEIESRN